MDSPPKQRPPSLAMDAEHIECGDGVNVDCPLHVVNRDFVVAQLKKELAVGDVTPVELDREVAGAVLMQGHLALPVARVCIGACEGNAEVEDSSAVKTRLDWWGCDLELKDRGFKYLQGQEGGGSPPTCSTVSVLPLQTFRCGYVSPEALDDTTMQGLRVRSSRGASRVGSQRARTLGAGSDTCTVFIVS